MDGVLIKNSALSAVWEVGPTNFVASFFGSPLRTMKVKKLLFTFLNRIEKRSKDTPFGYHQGMVMPQIMCDWQTGKKTPEEILARIKTYTKSDKGKKFFKKYGCKQAIKALCRFMFDPQRLAKTMDVLADGKKLLKKCKAAGHKIYILSNYSKEAFYHLPECNKRIRKLLELADGICISGELGLMKPDPNIFVAAFEQWGIDPEDETTVFFDDEPVNVAAGKMLNKKQFHATQIVNGSYDKAYKLLKELDLL